MPLPVSWQAIEDDYMTGGGGGGARSSGGVTAAVVQSAGSARDWSGGYYDGVTVVADGARRPGDFAAALAVDTARPVVCVLEDFF